MIAALLLAVGPTFANDSSFYEGTEYEFPSGTKDGKKDDGLSTRVGKNERDIKANRDKSKANMMDIARNKDQIDDLRGNVGPGLSDDDRTHLNSIPDLDRRVTTNEGALNRHEDELRTQSQGIARNRRDIADHETRITTNEAGIAANADKGQQNMMAIGDLDERYDGVDERVTQNSTNVRIVDRRSSRNTTSIVNNTNRLDVHSSNITNNTTRINTLDRRVDGHENRISQLEATRNEMSNAMRDLRRDIAIGDATEIVMPSSAGRTKFAVTGVDVANTNAVGVSIARTWYSGSRERSNIGSPWLSLGAAAGADTDFEESAIKIQASIEF